MNVLSNDFLHLVATTSLSTFLVIVILYLLRSIISERLKRGIKHEYDEQLANLQNNLRIQAESHNATLKASLEKEMERLRMVATSITETQKAAIERKLIAIDTLWDGLLSFRTNLPQVITVLDILKINEYNEVSKHPPFIKYYNENSEELISKAGLEASKALLKHRPYLGEYVSSIYTAYMNLFLRIAYCLFLSKQSSKYFNWHNDSIVKKILDASLTASELSDFNQLIAGRITWLHLTFEKKILIGLNEIISGEKSSNELLSQSHKIDEIIRDTTQSQLSGKYDKE